MTLFRWRLLARALWSRVSDALPRGSGPGDGPRSPPFACPRCGASFETESGLAGHRELFHSVVDTDGTDTDAGVDR